MIFVKPWRPCQMTDTTTQPMSTDYRATPEQWESIDLYAGIWDTSATYSCILELRARIEALEATQQPRPKPPSLKEQALRLLETYNTLGVMLTTDQADTIRRALEALPE